MQSCARCIRDASGVEPKAAPGGQDGQICGMSDGGIDAGEAGGREPPRRLSGGRCCRSRGQSCAARCRRRRRWCSHWCGHYCTARCGAKCGRVPQERPHEWSERCSGRCAARCAAKPAPGDARGAADRAEAMPAAGAAGQGDRDEVCDECYAKRRREESAAVMRALPSNAAPAVAVRHAAVSEASRRASGARSDRRERRREGYPPEGARPRSGLDRVARSRSDAPSLIVRSRETVSKFDTIGCMTVCTFVASIGVTRGRIGVTASGTGIATIIGIAVGACRTLSLGVERSCGGRAAEPPRSAAPQATREAKANGGGVDGGGRQRKRATPPERRGP